MADTATDTARALCKRNWWVFLVGGIASVLFGIAAIVNPGIALLLFAAIFAASFLVDGIVNVYGALSNREKDGWWVLLLIGIVGIAAGAYALLNPALSMVAFVMTVAFAALVFGALLVALGVKVRRHTEREWMLYLSGALSLVFGALILFQPLAGALSVVYLIASWAIALGVLKIAFALRVRNLPEASAAAA
jgi:uncharacterized membrane protein HdeD (DUF308 family)